MSRIHVASNKVVLPRNLKPEQGEKPESGYETGKPEHIKDLVTKDPEIESRGHRESFGEGDGDISIIVTAGDEPGDLRVSVQYEGQIERYAECLSRQGELIQHTADWLRKIFEKFGADWTADVTSAPCDKGDTRLLGLNDVVQRLEGRRTQPKVQPHIPNSVRVRHKK